MTSLFNYVPNPGVQLKIRLNEFIDGCKSSYTFGGDVWEDLRWDAIKFTKLTAPKNARGKVEDHHRFSDEYREFSKACIWYMTSHRPMLNKTHLYMAFRVLEKALFDVYQCSDAWKVDIVVLDQAVSVIRDAYAENSGYTVSTKLTDIAKFLAAHRLVDDIVEDWKCSIQRPRRMSSGLGGRAHRDRNSKLPSDDALDAVAEIFSQDPDLPRDIIVTSFLAMSMCAPQRASEILALPVNAEVNEVDREGIDQYGWRFFSGKGFEGDIKWVPSTISPVGKKAFDRIRVLTEPARQFAKWVEDHPDRFYRHSECPDVDEDEPLTIEQVAAALGYGSLSIGAARSLFHHKSLRIKHGSHTLRMLWPYVLSRLPQGFPWLDKEKKIKFSNALFCMHRNQIHASRRVIAVELQVLTYHSFIRDLGPCATQEGHTNLFKRHGYVDGDGEALKLTTHHPRHLLNTIAQRAGLSEEYIAKWSGRANVRQNRTYDHRSNEERLIKVRDALLASPPPSTVSVKINSEVKVVSTEDFYTNLKPATHVTEIGFCEHNFIISPCLRFANCDDCEEHVCVKGDDVKLERIRQRLARQETVLALALETNTDIVIGADEWVASHQKSIERLKQLISILSDPDLPDGSLVRLTGGNYSHIHRAIASNLNRRIPGG